MKKAKCFAMIFVVASIILCVIGCSVETAPIHEHTFATVWTYDAENHWKAATCEHTSEVTEKAKHTFGEYVSNNDATTEADGTKTRKCSVCGYEDTVADEGSKIHVHTFATEWTYDGVYHWKAATCEHAEEVSEKGEHIFGEWTTTKEPTEEEVGIKEQVCSVCNYKKTEEIEKIPTGFVLIKAGTFQMGSTAGESYEKPVHEVTLTKNFYMGKYEVTQGEYEKYCTYGGTSPSSSYGDGDNYPAYYVNWYDALVYCNKRSIDEGLTPCYRINEETDPTKWGTVPEGSNSTWDAVVCDWEADGYRLPTEAEWEYASRAGDNTTSSKTYSGTSSTSSLRDYAWYNGNSNNKSHEVGTKKANAFGLYDMSGNVREWCWNWYTSSYNTITEGGNDPTGALWGSTRVYRGGGWGNLSGSCSVSRRSGSCYPYCRYNDLGLRLVRASSK
jgi:formylglycine-generating enzyme required for sulfatase activity